MTRTEAIAEAIKNELLPLAQHLNNSSKLRGLSFDVKFRPDGSIRAVIVRTELERELPGRPG